MTWRVLVSAPYMQPVLHEYQHVFAENNIELVIPPVRERLSEEELLPWIGDIDGVICGDDQFTERLLHAAPRLKVISKWGTGVDSIDHKAACRAGVRVYNTPNAFTEPVADTVLGYILCFARQLPWMDRDIRSGVWTKRHCVALRECTFGVIGVGNIGKVVIRRAIAFGMRVFGNDIIEIPLPFVAESNLEVLSLDDLLRQADFVSLHCDLNPTSFHLIGERELQLMRTTAFLVNTARGPVVDEEALVRALQEHRIAGAALDVFEEEPLPDHSPLRRFDNVLLAPHSANSSREAWRRVHENTIQNLLEGLKASG
ncbi:MAG: phosphoglycerate dehydrogenase [Verrucomicrobia bacterium]|nr:phosphoglycerate dehydrogenase [Verrucomicrobiota bacterium]